MKYCCIFFLLVISFQTSNAQRRRPPARYLDTLSVRVSPLGLIDPFDGNITAGIAYTINSRLTLTTDISCILYSAYMPRNTTATGYIFKPALRYYLSDKRKLFIESAPFYKRVSYNMHEWINKDVVNGVPTYEEYTRFRYRKQVFGLNMQIGFQKGLMRGNRLRMEIYAGIGIRFKWQDIKNQPNATYDPDAWFFDNSFYVPYRVAASVPHGLRIVYVLK